MMDYQQIKTPTATHYQTLLARGLKTADGDKETFIHNHIEGITTLLQKRADSYLNYGPWWWQIKRLLNARSPHYWGDCFDHKIAKIHHFDDTALLVVAAWDYSNKQFQALNAYSHQHYLNDGSWKGMPYLLSDPDMEEKIYEQQINNTNFINWP
ncbi:hypothetical protein [Paraferrimonas sp. SM1919]|uniref:hypothetical protein n=1 Tax=Paraferrimonas sp. SM1919 TaxID=2662263 RepID=UPI0013D43BD9|nr:hypothetical protein [Paraferrimonas sp. SM1919]